MRRSISAIMLALAAGILSLAASAAASAQLLAAPGPQSFGARLVDVPVSEATNPRALRYIIDYLPTGTVIHRRIPIMNQESRPAHFTVYPDAAPIAAGSSSGPRGKPATSDWLGQRAASGSHPRAGASVMDMITIRGRPRDPGRALRRRLGPADGSVARLKRLRRHRGIPGGDASTWRSARWCPSDQLCHHLHHRAPVSHGQPSILVHVNNTGGRAVDLDGGARLADGPGSSSAGPFPVKKIITLAPGQTGNITFAPPKSLPVGSWRVTPRLASGLTTCTATANVQFVSVVAAPGGCRGWSGSGWLSACCPLHWPLSWGGMPGSTAA